MLGVGIIGCGAITPTFIHALKEIEGVQLHAISCRNVAKAREMVQSHECVADIYAIDEELLARADIDVVCICNPSGLHGESAIKAAKAKKHVIVEKPIEITLEKIDQMIRVCDENKVKLAGIFNNRYLEGNLFVKKVMQQGRLGRLIHANASIRWYREPDYYLSSKWKGTWALDGGGALMNQGIHYVDLLQWFIGDIESICAYTGTLLHHTIETEDTAVAIFKSRSGALGTITAGTSIYPGFAAKIELTGERGSLCVSDGILETWAFVDEDELDQEAVEFMQANMGKPKAAESVPFHDTGHKNQLMRIFDEIKNDTPIEVDGEEARKSVKIVRSIYDSVKQGKEIRL